MKPIEAHLFKISGFVFFTLIAFYSISNGNAGNQYFDAENRLVVCEKPLPEFTLSETSAPNSVEVKNLCECIWENFPDGGWEQQTSQKLRQGKDAGWRTRAFISRFSGALEKCGGFNL